MGKKYSVKLVEEAQYQRAVEELRSGEHVTLAHVSDIPHDPRAIVCQDGNGRTLGYLVQDHWLADAMIDEGKVVAATVERIEGGNEGRHSLSVVLTVELLENAPAKVPPALPVRKKVSIVGAATEAALGAAEKSARHQRLRAALGPSPEEDAKRFRGADDEQNAKKVGIGCAVLLALVLLVSVCTGGGDDAGEEDGAFVTAEETAASDGKEAVVAWQSAIYSAMQPCDTASAAMGAQMTGLSDGTGSMLGGYQAASVAKDQCFASYRRLSDIDAPEGPWEDTADDVLETCQFAAITRQDAAEAAMVVFNGDLRASALTDLQTQSSNGATQLQACVFGIFKVLNEAGIETDDEGNPVLPEGSGE